MEATAMLNVDDVESSSRWYQQLLGCQSGHGGADFEMLMDDKKLLMMLHRSSAHHHPSSPPPNVERGVGVCIFVRVKDLEAVAKRATDMGLNHEGIKRNELAHQDELEVRDPDGYHVTVCGPAPWASVS